ncbi:molybdate ABC transporter permease subunit [Halosimplex amylolyticum]|uniref:molybdate ABC transporter permease subunit n=1 Tax=Halosimplex amylolyticum TaxID=3396616 RepID=UPI003F56A08F
MSRVASARDRPGWETAAPLVGAALLALYALPIAWLLVARPPASVLDSLSEPFVVDAARNTLVSASASTALALGFGLPLAYWLARTEFRGQTLVTAVVAFPLVLPPVVSGMVLLSVFGSNGLGGVGLSVDGTLAGVVLAQTFVASPFVVLSARSAFERVDRRLEEVAWTEGVSRWRTVRRVTLPLARRGVLAGATLAFARAAGEFGATLMLAYYPRTLPVQIWATFQGRGLDAAVPVAVVLVAVASGALVVLNLLGGSSLVGLSE